MTDGPVLKVENLVTHFKSVERGKVIKAVDGISFDLMPGEIVGLVGESGCGKSTLGRTIVGLERPQSGRILLDGIDLSTLKGKALRTARRAVQYIFQDPYSSMNDRQTIGEIISEALQIFGVNNKNAQLAGVKRQLDQVGLPISLRDRYAREISGGQRQRVAIARALAVEPRVLICDEPVSALDLSVRAQVMNLFLELKQDLGVACLFIAHDLALVRQASSRVHVMYLGRIMESGTSDEIYERPSHPYTQALIASIPNPDPIVERARVEPPIIGDIPSPTNLPTGCRFQTRCPRAADQCREIEPTSVAVSETHRAACVFTSSLYNEQPIA